MLDTIQEMSDEKLMELYQIGDLYAFNVLYQRYEHKIYGYFHRFFPEERCADLLQETFLKVHRSRSRYKTSLPFSKWLFVIVCNLAKDEFKRLSRLKEYLDDGQLGDTRTFLVDPETPESIVEHDELWERIRQAILDLPENDREAIIQSKYEGKSYPEIAESMDITAGAVKQRAYRGLLALREKLKDLVEPELKKKTKKGFSALMIFKFQGIIKKVLIGGLEAMKISAKVKIVTIGVAALLMLSGTGIVVWRSHESNIKVLGSPVSQTDQGKVSAHTNLPSSSKDNSHKLAEKQKGEQADKIISWLDSLGENPNNETKVTKTGTAKAGDTMLAGEANKPKFVKDFPEFDLSTPESAWATIMRIMARSRGDWTQVSLRKDREMMAEYPNDDVVSPEQSENFLNAEILEVHVSGDRAGVISQIPNQDHAEPWLGPIDLRSLAKEDGEWRNVSNDRVSTIDEARRKFENSLNRPIP
jgi:RNA polymerase sigma-70 factor (ECF subfamily)